MSLGLALGGGGAKGFAHLGVFLALQDAGIEIDVFTGTSIGAIVGAACAAGHEQALIDRICAIELKGMPSLLSPNWPMQGLFSGKRILTLLSETIPFERIEDLPKPFAAIAVDLVKSERVALTRGPLIEALRASSSIPVLFKPVSVGDQVLVDGALIDPVPVSAALDLDALDVIAVDLFANRSDKATLGTGSDGLIKCYLDSITRLLPVADAKIRPPAYDLVDVAMESLSIVQRELTAARLADSPPIFTFSPPVSDIGILDFHRAEEEIERCYDWAKSKIPELYLAMDV